MTILFCFKFEVSSTLLVLKSLYILRLIKSLMDCPVSMKHNLPKNTFNPVSDLSMEYRNALLKKDVARRYWRIIHRFWVFTYRCFDERIRNWMGWYRRRLTSNLTRDCARYFMYFLLASCKVDGRMAWFNYWWRPWWWRGNELIKSFCDPHGRSSWLTFCPRYLEQNELLPCWGKCCD